MSKDHGLDHLLALDGEILAQDKGYWVKIEARKLPNPTEACPHSIRYCLTLHDRYGQRVPGFDNAHLIVTRKRGRFSGRCVVYDHKHTHPGDKGTPYVFESAEQLLDDFFTEVDKVLRDES